MNRLFSQSNAATALRLMMRNASALLVFALMTVAVNAQVFISQYIETDSGTSPKGIEVYNASGADIVFSPTNALEVYQGTNGSPCSSLVTVDSGTLLDGEVWVIGTTDLLFFAVSNGTDFSGSTNYNFAFNGDDALELYLGGVLQDVFGTCGSDPGSSWSGSGVSTQNQNIEILPGNCFGTTTYWTDPSTRFAFVATGGFATGFGDSPTCSGPLPEPTNHVTSFACSVVSDTEIDLSWIDAVGAQLPENYLIRWSTINYGAITTPTDGIAIPDGPSALNVAYGAESASITGLTENTTYYFRIFPYTNSGGDIDYKTDGTFPETDCTTLSATGCIPFFNEDFESNGAGVRYTLNTSTGDQFSDGSGDFFTQVPSGTVAGSYVVTGQNNTGYFAAMDTDGEPEGGTVLTLTFDDINIAGQTDMELSLLAAEDDDGTNQDWDNNTLFYVEVDYDNSGTFTKVLQFAGQNATNTEPGLDENLDGFYDQITEGPTLTDIFTSFTVPLLGTGSTLDVRLVFENLDAGDEDIAIDDIEICGTLGATITTGTVSTAPFTLSDCGSTASGTVDFTTTGTFNAGNVFSAELSDATGDFSNPITIGTGTTSPLSITIPENLPGGTGYVIRVVSSDPSVSGTLSAPFEIIQNGSNCPELGDYRTRASGEWVATDVWQTYVYNATTQVWEWQDVTSHPDSDTVNAYIITGDTIAVTVSSKFVNNLEVQSGAKLFRDATDCSNRYLNIVGDIVCDGQIGNGSTPDALGLNIQAGTHTFSGSGVFDVNRIRLSDEGVVALQGSAVLNINMDVNVNWDPTLCGGLGSGTNAVYNNLAGAANFDVVIGSGSTLAITNTNASLGMDGSGTASYVGTERTGGYVVNGVLDVAGWYNAGSNNTTSGAGSVYLTVNFGGNVNVGYIDFGADNVTDGGAINVLNGGRLALTGVASGADAWANTTAGSIVDNLENGGTIAYAAAVDQNVPDLFTYGGLELSGTGNRTFTAVTTNINGDFTLESGATALGSDPNYILNVGGDWNNNGGVFTTADGTVVFNGTATQTIGGSAITRFGNITMDSGNTLTLATDTEVHGVFAPESGSFDSGANTLILVSDATGTGSIGEIKPAATYTGSTTVQRYIPSGVQNWVNLGNPLTAQTVADWNDDLITTGFTGSDFPTYADQETGQLFNNVLSYDETVQDSLNEGFVGVADVTDLLDAERGYFVYMQGAVQNVSVTGSIQQGNLTTSLNYTDSPLGASEDGWELVTNRYPSEVSFDSLYNNATNIASTYYIYNADNGSYNTYTVGVGGTASGFIPSSQSFWVQTIGASPELVFEEQFKSATGTVFERSFPNVPTLTLEISADAGSQITTLAMQEGYTLDFELGMDAFQLGSMSSAVPQIAFVATEGELTAVNRFNPEAVNAVPVNVEVEPGTYTIEVLDNEVFSDASCISIEDLITGEVYPLEEGFSFTFTQEEEAFDGVRFMLHIVNPLSELDMEPATCDGSANGSITFDCLVDDGTVELTTLDGIVIASTDAVNGTITFNGLEEGDYAVNYLSASLDCGSVQRMTYVETLPAFSAEYNTTDPTCNALGTGVINVYGANQAATVNLYIDGELIMSESIVEELTLAGLDAGTYELEFVSECSTDSYTLTLNDDSAIAAELEGPSSLTIIEGEEEVNGYFEVLGDNTDLTIEWFVNGVAAGEGQLLDYTFSANGTYEVLAVISNGVCTTEIVREVIIDTATSVTDVNGSSLTIATLGNGWQLSGLDAESDVLVEVYDARGALVTQFHTNSAATVLVPFSELSAGVYTVRLMNDQRVLHSAKLVRP
jgi:hypothetical protein